MTLYRGPRCRSCGGDHFPQDGPDDGLEPKQRRVLLYLTLTALALFVILGLAGWPGA